MFATRLVPGVANVSLEVTRFVAMEVIERLCSAIWKRSMVAMTRIVAVVHMAVENRAARGTRVRLR